MIQPENTELTKFTKPTCIFSHMESFLSKDVAYTHSNNNNKTLLERLLGRRYVRCTLACRLVQSLI